MIIKSLSRKTANFGQLISYILKSETIDPERGFVYTHNLHGKEPREWIQQFKNLENRRLYPQNNNIRMHHDIVSFSPKLAHLITPQILLDICKEFVYRKSKRTLCMASPHFTDHPHIHFCSSSLQLNGLSNSISKQNFHKLKISMSRFIQDRYPELGNMVQHGKSKNEYLRAKKEERSWDIESVTYEFKTLFNLASTFDELRDLALERNFKLIGSIHTPSGVEFENGTKYSFKNLGLHSEEQKLALSNLRERSEKEERDLDFDLGEFDCPVYNA